MAKKKPKYHVRPDGLHETIRRINGKRVAFRGRTDAEVERKMLAYKGEVERGRLFKDVAEVWERETRNHVTVNTWEKCYLAPYNRAVAWFSERSVKEITPLEIDAAIKARARGGVSKQTVSVQLQVIRQIMSQAMLDGDIIANPADAVKLPRNLPQKRREMPTDEQINIIKSAKPEGMGLFALLVLYTGMRRGEALAITGIDFSDDKVIINKSVYHTRTNLPQIKEPKTKKGTRTVPLLSPLKASLPDKLPSGYLFSDDGGNTPLTAKQFTCRWKRWAGENGVTITPHQLRHGYATILFEAGLEPKDMQDLLGHAQLSTSMDIYTHISESRREHTKKKLEEYLNPTETQGEHSKPPDH
jgi:integrase